VIIHLGSLRRPVALLAFALAAWQQSAIAQTWAVDPAVERIAWGPVNVLVRADSCNGVHLWAQSSKLGYTGSPIAYVAAFDPDLLNPWLDRANFVLTFQSPPAGDSVLALQTPPLIAFDSSRLVLGRRSHKGKWAKQVTLLFLDPAGAHPWSIETTLDEADDFLQVLWAQGLRSGVCPDTTSPLEANPIAEGTCPVPLGNPHPLFPEHLVGLSGEVWMTFVVQADGRPDPTSFRAVLFDNSAFADAAFEALRHARYRPATRLGKPVPMRVATRVTFKTE
jgi:hypothetical protein